MLSIADDITILPKDYRYLLGRVSAVDFDQCGDFEVAYREHHDMEAERYIDLKKIWKYDIVK